MLIQCDPPLARDSSAEGRVMNVSVNAAGESSLCFEFIEQLLGADDCETLLFECIQRPVIAVVTYYDAILQGQQIAGIRPLLALAVRKFIVSRVNKADRLCGSQVFSLISASRSSRFSISLGCCWLPLTNCNILNSLLVSVGAKNAAHLFCGPRHLIWRGSQAVPIHFF
jgi:hypothetical protein